MGDQRHFAASIDEKQNRGDYFNETTTSTPLRVAELISLFDRCILMDKSAHLKGYEEGKEGHFTDMDQ